MPRRLPPTPLTPFDVNEVDDIPFRFGREMLSGEAIADVAVDCRSVGAVDDPTPMARVAVPHQVVGTDVLQRFVPALEGTRYVLRVEATMTSGRVFVGAALIAVVRL